MNKHKKNSDATYESLMETPLIPMNITSKSMNEQLNHVTINYSEDSFIIPIMKTKIKLLTLLSTPVLLGGVLSPLLFLNQCSEDKEELQNLSFNDWVGMHTYLLANTKYINTTDTQWNKTDPDFFQNLETNISMENFVNGIVNYGSLTSLSAYSFDLKLEYSSSFLSCEMQVIPQQGYQQYTMFYKIKYYNKKIKMFNSYLEGIGDVTYGENLNLNDLVHITWLGPLYYALVYTGTFSIPTITSANLYLYDGDLNNISLT